MVVQELPLQPCPEELLKVGTPILHLAGAGCEKQQLCQPLLMWVNKLVPSWLVSPWNSWVCEIGRFHPWPGSAGAGAFKNYLEGKHDHYIKIFQQGMSGLTKPLLAPIASLDLNIQQLPDFPVERWNPGVLPQHQDASGGLQVGPAHRCQHAGGALQPQADPRVLRPGRGHLLFWPSGRKIKLFSVTGALIVANFSLVMPRVQPKRQICTSGVGGGGFRSYSGLKEILLPHKKS